MIDPGDDARPARAGKVNCPGDFVDGEAAAGKKAGQVGQTDAGQDVPDVVAAAGRETFRSESAAELDARRPRWHAG